jgi:hypothetical protein
MNSPERRRQPHNVVPRAGNYSDAILGIRNPGDARVHRTEVVHAIPNRFRTRVISSIKEYLLRIRADTIFVLVATLCVVCILSLSRIWTNLQERPAHEMYTRIHKTDAKTLTLPAKLAFSINEMYHSLMDP